MINKILDRVRESIKWRLIYLWYRLKSWLDSDYGVITLSNSKCVLVRRLGLYELDGKGREPLGPYCYSILTVTGQIIEDEYDLQSFDEPPKPPDIPVEEIQEGSGEWHQLREYETYQAALVHEKKRLESYEDYVADIAAYVLANCLAESDRNRVMTPDDWHKVQSVAIVPRLTEEVLADTLRDTFPGFIW